MYVEFRIASNPPLLPSGVAWVMDKVTEALRPVRRCKEEASVQGYRD